MQQPLTIRDILYGIRNTRDADLTLFQRELKRYLLTHTNAKQIVKRNPV